MKITEYIKNKNNIRLFNLSGNQKIVDDLELSKLSVKSTLQK